LTPRGGGDRIDGWARDGAGQAYLKARVRVPPEDGKANTALMALIAKACGRPVSSVRIVAGHAARLKTLEIDGIDAQALAAAIGSPPD
jgi:uncharacterized protein YggU (UPF0235/DUF167 family)